MSLLKYNLLLLENLLMFKRTALNCVSSYQTYCRPIKLMYIHLTCCSSTILFLIYSSVFDKKVKSDSYLSKTLRPHNVRLNNVLRERRKALVTSSHATRVLPQVYNGTKIISFRAKLKKEQKSDLS